MGQDKDHMSQDGHGAKLEGISDCSGSSRRDELEVRLLTRSAPVRKPWAATQVISSGGSTSPLWLDGGGILVCPL